MVRTLYHVLAPSPHSLSLPKEMDGGGSSHRAQGPPQGEKQPLFGPREEKAQGRIQFTRQASMG